METKNKFVPQPLPERYKQRNGQADYHKYGKRQPTNVLTGLRLLVGGWAVSAY